jgi:hypothetical protein
MPRNAAPDRHINRLLASCRVAACCPYRPPWPLVFVIGSSASHCKSTTYLTYCQEITTFLRIAAMTHLSACSDNPSALSVHAGCQPIVSHLDTPCAMRGRNRSFPFSLCTPRMSRVCRLIVVWTASRFATSISAQLPFRWKYCGLLVCASLFHRRLAIEFPLVRAAS